jgi:class 3 adenylate cyclase
MSNSRFNKILLGSKSEEHIEYRLFLITCLIMCLWTIYDLIQIPMLESPHAVLLEISYAGVFCVTAFAYFYSRITGRYVGMVALGWAVLLVLFAETWFMQAGSHGTIAFVMFPGVMVLLIVTPGPKLRWTLVALVTLFVTALILVSEFYPNLVTPYASAQDRFTDYITTVATSFLVTGIVTVYYVGNYRRTAEALYTEKKRIEVLTDRLKKYLPSQVVDSLDKVTHTETFEPQRKRITVFFSDIKDFTPHTDALEPEDLTRLLNEYMTEMTTIASRWGGTIDKFVGDAMMVFFGAPASLGEKQDAIRCLRMAIDMQKKVIELRQKWFEAGFEIPFQIRVGIHSGIAAVGDFGTFDRLSYTAIGGEVNLASRIQGVAKPGGITISHPTWAFVKEEIVCHPRPDKVTLKGIPREFTLYDVVF